MSWNDAVFASMESAEEYIKNQPEIYWGDQNRIEELEGKIHYTLDELTEEERAELEFLQNRWQWTWRNCPSYRIEEFEVFG
jgi:hypothetical protein